MWRRILSLFRNLFRRKRVDDLLDEELRSAVEILARERMQTGIDPKEARRQALIELGGAEQVKEKVRDARSGRLFEDIWVDIRYGVRMLRKNPGFTAVAVLTLALGIGATTTIFSWVNTIVFNPIPGVQNSGALLDVTITTREGRNISFSYPNYEDYRDRNTVLEGIIVHSLHPMSMVRETGEAERILGSLVSGNMFDVFGVRAIVGRTFLPEEDEVPGRNPVVVISYGLWQRSFGGDPEVTGTQISINTHPFTIIGVAPEKFQGPQTAIEVDAYSPTMMQRELVAGGDRLRSRCNGWLQAKAKLKPRVSLEQAQAEMSNIAAQLAEEYPDPNEGRGIALYTISKSPNSAVHIVLTPVLFILLGVVAFVMLIACANVANLLLARATSRRKEIAIRLSLGAGRMRLVRQLLTESVILAILGGLFAAIAAFWTSNLLRTLIPSAERMLKLETEIDIWVLSFTLGLSLLTGVIFGLIPALQASRSELVGALNDESGRSSGSRSKGRLRNTLVVAQVSLSLVLLISAGLLVRTLKETQSIKPGFGPDNVLLSSVDLFPNGYSREGGHAFFRQLLEGVRALPGVESAALGRYVPMSLVGSSDTSFRVDGYEPGPNERVWAYYNHVTPDYFRTMQISQVGGREFSIEDTDAQANVVIIDELMAEQYFRGQDPIGKQLHFESSSRTIVGVVGHVTFQFINESPLRMMYFPVFQSNRNGMVIHVRSKGDTTQLFSAIRVEVQKLDPKLPVFSVRTLRETIAISSIQQRIAGSMMGAFGLLALALASVGIYGVLVYTVSQRTHEIGIRMALGAGKLDVLKLVLQQGLVLTAIGAGIGLAGAFGLTRLLSNLLYGVSPTDQFTYIGMTALMTGVSLLACYIPARRATKVDPMVALRYE